MQQKNPKVFNFCLSSLTIYTRVAKMSLVPRCRLSHNGHWVHLVTGVHTEGTVILQVRAHVCVCMHACACPLQFLDDCLAGQWWNSNLKRSTWSCDRTLLILRKPLQVFFRSLHWRHGACTFQLMHLANTSLTGRTCVKTYSHLSIICFNRHAPL